LGRTRPDRDWHPCDGRITELGLHVDVDPAIGNGVLVNIVAATGQQRVSMSRSASASRASTASDHASFTSTHTRA
jgi:hypothetical protein